jgi:hypothetical protein
MTPDKLVKSRDVAHRIAGYRIFALVLYDIRPGAEGNGVSRAQPKQEVAILMPWQTVVETADLPQGGAPRGNRRTGERKRVADEKVSERLAIQG